jgi:hypothetical protein
LVARKRLYDEKKEGNPAHFMETSKCLPFRKKQVHWNAGSLLHRGSVNPTLAAELPFSFPLGHIVKSLPREKERVSRDAKLP